MTNRSISQTYVSHKGKLAQQKKYSSDQDLLAQIAKGDKECFGILYQRYLDQIYTYVYYHVNQNHPETEDLTEDVFLRTFISVLENSSKNKNFKALVFKIARNLVIDRYRKHKDEVDIENIKLASNDHLNPEMTWEKAQLTNKLSTAITDLKPDQKEVIILRYILDLSTEEIAQMMGITHNYVRVIQFRALKNMKVSL